jgi:acyl-homoserine lactone synthase
MIRISTGYSLADRTDASMFEDRKRLFVDLLGWDVRVLAGRYEIDTFDGPDATYIAALDGSRDHLASLRLLPTTGPHILGDLFPQLCDGAVPRGPAIAEITRLCLPLRVRAGRRLQVRNQLISAMADHALQAGLRALTGVVAWTFLE